MWPYHPDLLSRPVPRYTSFPTAAEFTPEVGAPDYEEALESVTSDVSLYVHIPFCEKICWYCGCNTGAANRKQRLANYLEALHCEIALVGARLPRGTKVRRVAFGGGSPNAIAPTDFVRLMHALTLHFQLATDAISIELDPRTLDDTWLDVLKIVGITHASMGVQTFSPHLQSAIGRVQPAEMIERGTSLLRDAGVTSLNFDLMYGLPGQTQDDLADALDRTVALGANRIALFGYAHVPHLIPRQRQIDAENLPGQDDRFAMAAAGYRKLTGMGYDPVGFDHFALPGDPLAQAALSGRLRRNFQGFTEDDAPVLIGLGASAIGGFPGLLAQNEKNAGRYRMLLSQGILPIAGGIRRSEDDQQRGAMIEGLLCQGRAFVERELLRQALESLEPFLDLGLCSIEACSTGGATLAIPAQGLPYARTIAALFDPHRQHSPRRFSSAV